MSIFTPNKWSHKKKHLIAIINDLLNSIQTILTPFMVITTLTIGFIYTQFRGIHM